MDRNLIGNSERPERAQSSSRAVDAAKAFIFQENYTLMSLVHVDPELWASDVIYAWSQQNWMWSIFFVNIHLEIEYESQITTGGRREEQMFSFKNESLYLESKLYTLLLILIFTFWNPL